MNLVGKILTSLIVFFCLVLMGFVMAIYAGHTNWRNKVVDPNNGYKVQLDKMRNERDEATKKLDTAKTEFGVKVKDFDDRLANAKSARDEAVKERDTVKGENDKLQKEITTNRSAMQDAGQTCEAQRKEIELLRKDSKDREDAHRDQYKAMVKATDDLHKKINEYNALNEKMKVMGQELADARYVLNLVGLKPNPKLYANMAPDVRGRVTAVRGDGLIEIDIGEDSLLNKGHQLDVFRNNGSSYLGRVEVYSTEATRSVCRLLPGQQEGLIQKDDVVASNTRARLRWPIQPSR